MNRKFLIGICILVLTGVALIGGCINEKQERQAVKEPTSLSDCEKIADKEGYNVCVANVALAKQDAALCDKIPDSGNKDACINTIALAKQDAALCDKISGPGNKDACINTIALETQNDSLCEKVLNSRYNCTQKVYEKIVDTAVAEQDAALCDKISGSGNKDACINTVAVETQNDSLCEKASSSKYNCTRTVYAEIVDTAVAEQDAALCGKISDSEDKDACINTVAVETQNDSLCEKISDLYYKDKCITYVAKAKQDASLCEKIRDPGNRDTCVEVFT